VSLSPVLVLQLDASDPVGRLGDWLTAAGLELDVRVLTAGDAAPEDLSAHRGLVVLGGSMSANDRAPAYLGAVRDLLRQAVVAEVPTLGVCLGGQLLAVANGGRVETIPDGPEIGAQLIAKRSAAADDPLFGSLPITPDVLQWHYDAITALPPGAVQLASSPACDQQAFRLGRLAWGLQFHIETTPETVRAWATEDALELADYDLDRVVERAAAAHDDIAEVWQPFAASFAAVVRDPAAVQYRERVIDPVRVATMSLAAELQASRAPLQMPPRRPADG
jgi:GMP synthase-like glutamine amidotransferase